MKIIVSGSLGHISKPLAIQLVEKGHQITVISSNPEKRKEIEGLGAVAAIGSLEDVDFLAAVFKGAAAVYCMIPPGNYFDRNFDLIAYYKRLGNNYHQAIMRTGVKRVVNLSTIGAHLEKGAGILLGAHNAQNILNSLPQDVAITHMRPTSFFYNLYGYLEMIKSRGAIITNYGTGAVIPWVSPLDIADAVAEEIVTPLVGRKIRYVASEELTGQESAGILGEAIGKPAMKWILATDNETLQGLTDAGMNTQIAAGLVEMYAGLQSGLLSEDYFRNRPAVMGKVKLKDFAKEFAQAFKLTEQTK
jgi:uncharacterized protein YbjT (DUF2867 family)